MYFIGPKAKEIDTIDAANKLSENLWLCIVEYIKTQRVNSNNNENNDTTNGRATKKKEDEGETR